MNLSLFRAAVLAAVSIAVVPAAATAAPTPWGGSGSNDLGPAYALLSVANGKVSVKVVQMILACTEADGTETERAFDARHPARVEMRLNRYALDWEEESNLRDGRVRVNGQLGSRGRGTIRVRITTVAKESLSGAIIERCQGETRFALRRGPS